MPSRVLNWGILGTSRVNKLVLPAVQASPHCRMVAIAGRDEAHATASAAEWGIPRAYGTWEGLLADPKVEVVYIGLSNSYHVEWTLRAIAAGKHVLCEKPLALSAEGVDRIATAAEAAGVVVAEALFHLFHPTPQKVAELIAGGAIGPLRLVQAWFSINVQDETQSRLKPELGGGCLWDLGVYPISTLLHLCGEPAVTAGLGTVGHHGVDEAYAGVMRFPHDVYGQFQVSFRMARRMGLEITGADGTLTVPNPFRPGPADRLVIQRGTESEEVVVAGEEPYRPEVENMVAAVLDGAPLAYPLTASRRTIALVERLVHDLGLA